MTAVILQAARLTARFGAMVAPKFHNLRQHFLRGLDALAEARMRRAQFEAERCRRLMQPDQKSSVEATLAGR